MEALKILAETRIARYALLRETKGYLVFLKSQLYYIKRSKERNCFEDKLGMSQVGYMAHDGVYANLLLANNTSRLTSYYPATLGTWGNPTKRS